MNRNETKYLDTVTMARRCLLLSKRNPDTFLTSILMPVMMMLLFIALFGNLVHIDGVSYVNYIVPGVLLQCFGQCCAVTAIAVNKDITGGMIHRFRTLPVRQSSFLGGHILEALLRNLLTAVVVLAVSLPLGFSPSASVLGWIIVLMLLLLVILAFSWLGAVIGITANSAEGASSLVTVAIVLPYLSSGFVPVETMPAALSVFARYQPMTPIIDTIRNTLLGTPVSRITLTAAFLWCAALLLLLRFLAIRLMRRRLNS